MPALNQQRSPPMHQSLSVTQPAMHATRGLTPPNLLGTNTYQPTRALSQQGLSFSVPSGVGIPQTGAPMPTSAAPSFVAGSSPQVVAAPGRGHSFVYGQTPMR
jgi:hypothetical protein